MERSGNLKGNTLTKKLENQKGETLVETLVSILTISLTIAFLTTASLTSARINDKVRDTDVSFRYSEAAPGEQQTLSLRGDGLTGTARVQLYEENGFLYYTAAQEGTP